MLAATYEASAEQHCKEQDQNILDTKKVYEDLKIQLGETFRITDEQNACFGLIPVIFLTILMLIAQANIHAIAKDVIYEKSHMSVSFMHNDLCVCFFTLLLCVSLIYYFLDSTSSRTGALKFTNIFDIPTHEKELKKALKKTASSVRCTFCEDVCVSLR